MSCVSWPIPYKNPLRKLFFNLGFQFNYAEPFRPSNFYNATYFQNPFGGSRDLKDSLLPTNSAEVNSTVDVLTTEIDQSSRDESRSFYGSNELVGSDLTAAQLYESIENNIAE